MLQLCYSFMMQNIKRLFCAGLKVILRMPARCFGQACKVFRAGSQGCVVPSRTLRKGISYLACRLVNLYEALTRTRGGTICLERNAIFSDLKV